ncbi:MAG: methylmalonyl-CoA epimerase [Selenomonadaceae bacterium]|nr:methylmalonyl-CoA epimerase [Selenomonadaceae bacterium]
MSKFKVLGVDHLGIACGDLETGSKFWSEMLGVAKAGEESVASQKVTTVFHPMWNGSQAELLVPLNGDPESPIAKWMASNGGKGGIQHVALRVDNLAAAIEELMAKGVAMIDKAPRRGAGGADIAFMHPKSTGGILLELCQLRDEE